MKELINLKKKNFEIRVNWQDLSKKSIYFLDTDNEKNFIKYQKNALKKNCRHLLCKEKFKSKFQIKEMNYYYYKNSEDIHRLAKIFFKKVKAKLIFVTGTNGKTSVAYGSSQLMAINDIKTSYIGTLGFYINSKKIKDLNNTTPSFLEILYLLAYSDKLSVKYVFLEASSIGFIEGRLGYLNYDYCLLTNLETDHLDYHKNLKNYHNSKLSIVKNHSKKKSKIIIQDHNLIEKLGYIDNEIISQDNFITKNKINIIKKQNIIFEIKFKNRKYLIKSLNYFVIKNIISIFILYFLLSKKTPINFTHKIFPPGRSEIVHKTSDSLIIVDYAHSADAFKNLLINIPKTYKHKIILYGCGGDRDKSKRPKIAKIASKYTTLQIITNDNPRNENPKKIRDVLVKNSTNPISIASREKAIIYGLKFLKKKGGIFIVAGKGHENTQLLNNKVINFNDRKIIKKYAKNI